MEEERRTSRDAGRRPEAREATRPRRIVACLDVMDGRVVKGVRFRDHVDMGDVVELARRYQREGADELVFYDITASPQARTVDTGWVERVAAVVDVPLCVAGGVDTVERAARILGAGAAKVSINSPALTRPELIDELAAALGSERVVVGIDSECDLDGIWRVRRFTGDPAMTEALPRRTLDWVVEAQERGAGEIVLNCMGHDGVRAGYDIDQLKAAREVCRVPLVASGGAGAMEHFAEAFAQADVDGALAARVFHDGSVRIRELREYLTERGVALASRA